MIGDGSAELQMGVLKAADHKCRPGRRQWCNFSILVPFLTILATTTRLMILAAAFVASQPLFDADRRLFGTVIGIRRDPFSFQ